MTTPVIVIGAGPVGLTMAAELARYGVPVRIIDKAAGRTDKSKALVVWSRTLELLDRSGCGSLFVNAGFKVNAANMIAGSKQVGHVSLNKVDTPHPYALMLPQSDTERLLEAHLNNFGVSVERQVELCKFLPGDEKVTVTFKHPDGKEETVETPWLLGCDGAHSTVRHGSNMQFEGSTLPSDWILADIHLAGVQTKQDELNMYWHADGALAMFPITPGRYRIIADVGMAIGDAHRPDPTLEEVQAILDRRGPGGIIASDPVWLASFRINERKVANYSKGRIFLAGDAAHVHSPAGGQGMNTGMQDACNLGWKLAMVYHGVAAAEPLLGSYSIERSAVGRQVLKDAGRLTTVAVLRGGVAQAIRNHVASFMLGLAPVRNTMANKLTELSIGYPQSPLTIPGGQGHPAPGERAPVDVINPVGAGNRPRFALFAQADANSADVIERYADVLESKVRNPFSTDGIWLVRPDGYVALSARQNGWDAVDQYLQQIVNRTSSCK